MLVTTDFFCFLVPRATKVWVWIMAALGTTARLVQLSISAKMGMTSPAKQTHKHVRRGGRAQSCLEELLHRPIKGWPRCLTGQACGLIQEECPKDTDAHTEVLQFPARSQ